jgi:hypothetical protein
LYTSVSRLPDCSCILLFSIKEMEDPHGSCETWDRHVSDWVYVLRENLLIVSFLPASAFHRHNRNMIPCESFVLSYLATFSSPCKKQSNDVLTFGHPLVWLHVSPVMKIMHICFLPCEMLLVFAEIGSRWHFYHKAYSQ